MKKFFLVASILILICTIAFSQQASIVTNTGSSIMLSYQKMDRIIQSSTGQAVIVYDGNSSSYTTQGTYSSFVTSSGCNIVSFTEVRTSRPMAVPIANISQVLPTSSGNALIHVQDLLSGRVIRYEATNTFSSISSYITTCSDQPGGNLGDTGLGDSLVVIRSELSDSMALVRDSIEAIRGDIGGGESTNLSYTPSPTDGIVSSDTGTDATIPAGSATNASLMLPGDKTKLDGVETAATADQIAAEVPIIDAGGYYVATDVEAALQEEAVNRLSLDAVVGNLVTLSGVPVTSTDLGTFTGTTIADSETIKGALQDLETAVEAGGGGADSFLVSDSEIYRTTASTPTGNNITDILSGTIVPIASNPTLTDTIQKPFGFSAPVPFWISRNEDGTYATQYDDIRVWRDSFLSVVPTNGIYYVDGIAGSDANDGRTKATAKQTLNAVRVLTPAPRRVYIKGGLYKTNTFVMGADTLQLIAYGGTAEIFRSITFPASWTDEGGGVYSATQASVGSSRILMSTARDEEGVLIPLKQATALAELTNETNTYYTDGTTFYVILDGSAPVEFGNIIIAASAHTGMTQPRFYAEGVRWYGASSYGVSAGRAVFRDCSNYYLNDGSVLDLISFSNASTVYLYNSRFGYGGADIIDWTGAGTIGYEINCSGKWAGLSGSGSNDQVSTGHLGSAAVTINANYQFARSQALADINVGTQRWVLGGFFGNSWEYTSGAISALTDAELWVDNAKVGGRQFDYTVWDTGTLHLRNIKINQNSRVDVQVGGIINEY